VEEGNAASAKDAAAVKEAGTNGDAIATAPQVCSSSSKSSESRVLMDQSLKGLSLHESSPISADPLCRPV